MPRSILWYSRELVPHEVQLGKLGRKVCGPKTCSNKSGSRCVRMEWSQDHTETYKINRGIAIYVKMGIESKSS